MTENQQQNLEDKEKSEKPHTPSSLKTISAIRRELGKVYRDARSGRLDANSASKFCFILVSLAKLIESADLETRIDDLEKELSRVRR